MQELWHDRRSNNTTAAPGSTGRADLETAASTRGPHEAKGDLSMKPMKQNPGVERGMNLAAQAAREGAVVPCDTIDDIFRVAQGITGTLGGLAGAALPFLGAI